VRRRPAARLSRTKAAVQLRHVQKQKLPSQPQPVTQKKWQEHPSGGSLTPS